MPTTEQATTGARLSWYSRRLLAMTPLEIALHARKKWRQLLDTGYRPPRVSVPAASRGSFPSLPSRVRVPSTVRDSLRHDAEEILAGRWKAFGHLDLQVDDPPRWHKDYLAGVELATVAPAFTLNYRALPQGVDIKLIWELSRWYQPVRLAMAAYVLGHERAAARCLRWLEDWVTHNPLHRGWNWISALEAGIRLVQFAWIDPLLSAYDAQADHAESAIALSAEARLSVLRDRILPPHVAFTWRHRSFGSSANNHLLGELTGLILATVRWPSLRGCGTSLEELQRCWQREVLAQFAWDGGNREQALNYQLFSWELCWQARAALVAAGRVVAPEVDDRLRRAAEFYLSAQEPDDPWDYGDSDDAFVTPFFGGHARPTREWHHWLATPARSPAIDYWQGTVRTQFRLDISDPKRRCGRWQVYQESGYGVWSNTYWSLRWDLSPLGYLTTAAHGHADALHLSLWLIGVALVVDPGTGCYFAEGRLRQWLASRGAHNGPHSRGCDRWPRRGGPFLWSEHHPKPILDEEGANGLRATLSMPSGAVQRSVEMTDDGLSCHVRDSMTGPTLEEFAVRWQFAPGTRLEPAGERGFHITRHGVSAMLQLTEGWAEVHPVPVEQHGGRQPYACADDLEAEFSGITAPAFRRTEWAPYVMLVARRRTTDCVFGTTFVASTTR